MFVSKEEIKLIIIALLKYYLIAFLTYIIFSPLILSIFAPNEKIVDLYKTIFLSIPIFLGWFIPFISLTFAPLLGRAYNKKIKKRYRGYIHGSVISLFLTAPLIMGSFGPDNYAGLVLIPLALIAIIINIFFLVLGIRKSPKI